MNLIRNMFPEITLLRLSYPIEAYEPTLNECSLYTGTLTRIPWINDKVSGESSQQWLPGTPFNNMVNFNPRMDN